MIKHALESKFISFVFGIVTALIAIVIFNLLEDYKRVKEQNDYLRKQAVEQTNCCREENGKTN